ncbi:MAG: hypothetical protein AMK73_08810, partial [Planctomycetes bacterium SM23_32]
MAFAGVLGLPFVLRPRHEQAVAGEASRQLPERALAVLSVHSETIRREFERAFSRWTAPTHGYAVRVDWLDVGGTTQAVRYVEDQFERNPEGIGVDLFFG